MPCVTLHHLSTPVERLLTFSYPRSGAIDRDELAQVMMKVGVDVTDHELDNLMLEADSSGNYHIEKNS